MQSKNYIKLIKFFITLSFFSVLSFLISYFFPKEVLSYYAKPFSNICKVNYNVLICNNKLIVIDYTCIGINEFLLYISLIVSFYVTYKKKNKIVLFLSLSPLILIASFLRICLIIGLSKYFSVSFLHTLLLPTSLLIVLSLFYLFVKSNCYLIAIDLAAKEKNATGIAIYNEKKVFTLTAYKNEEIIKLIKKYNPSYIVVDCPLTNSKKPFRYFERKLMKEGFKFLPLNMKSMQELIKRFRKLKKNFDSVIFETHPSSVKKIIKDYKKFFYERKISFNKPKNKDEEDAIYCLISLICYKEGNYIKFGKFILPKFKS